jgi:hypothetical protein
MQAETGIQQLPGKEQNYMHQLVANNLQKILNKEISKKEKNKTDKEKQEWNTIKNIRQKIENNHLIVTKETHL